MSQKASAICRLPNVAQAMLRSIALTRKSILFAKLLPRGRILLGQSTLLRSETAHFNAVLLPNLFWCSSGVFLWTTTALLPRRTAWRPVSPLSNRFSLLRGIMTAFPIAFVFARPRILLSPSINAREAVAFTIVSIVIWLSAFSAKLL
jgi:hypothetical protein